MTPQENRSRIQPHWDAFEETTAWLAHCEAVEARIARQRLWSVVERRAAAELGWASEGKG